MAEFTAPTTVVIRDKLTSVDTPCTMVGSDPKKWTGTVSFAANTSETDDAVHTLELVLDGVESGVTATVTVSKKTAVVPPPSGQWGMKAEPSTLTSDGGNSTVNIEFK
jgi:hypothetical protein